MATFSSPAGHRIRCLYRSRSSIGVSARPPPARLMRWAMRARLRFEASRMRSACQSSAGFGSDRSPCSVERTVCPPMHSGRRVVASCGPQWTGPPVSLLETYSLSLLVPPCGVGSVN